MAIDFSQIDRTFQINDAREERHRVMRFPTRSDYVAFLLESGLIKNESEFNSNAELVEAVYLDWLKRGQVGCVFAQLLGRRESRSHVFTRCISLPSHTDEELDVVAEEIDAAIKRAIEDEECEGLTVLLPQLLDIENLSRLIWRLGERHDWKLESILPWRTLTRVGLRRRVTGRYWAEALGMGPFPQCFPPTRLSPVTSLEVRTKTKRGKFSKIGRRTIALHLADLPYEDFLGKRRFKPRVEVFTPQLRLRILGGMKDERAKAGVTYTVPTAIWSQITSAGQPARVD